MFSSRYRRSVAVLTLITLLWSLPGNDRQSYAFAGAVAVGAVAVGAAIATIGAVNYNHPASIPSGLGSGSWITKGTSIGSQGGNIGIIALASYAQWQDSVRANIFSKLVTAKIYWDGVVSAALADKTSGNNRYPNLQDALIKQTADGPSLETKTGDVIAHRDGKTYIVTATEYYPQNFFNPDYSRKVTYLYDGRVSVNGDYQPTAGFGPGLLITLGRETPPPPTARVRPEAEALLASGALVSPTDQAWPIADKFSGDIDKLIQDQPNIVHYVDTASPDKETDLAPPYTGPTGAGLFNPATPTPAQTIALQAGLTAQAAAAAAQAAAQAAQAAAASDPANKDKAAVAAQAAASAAALAAQQAQIAAQQAAADTKTDTVPSKEEDMTTAGITMPAIKSINFEPFLALSGVLNGKFPFSLLSSVSGLVGLLVSDSSAPVFDIPMPLGNSMRIDLSVFNGVAAVSRFVFSLLLTLGIIFYVVRRFIS